MDRPLPPERRAHLRDGREVRIRPIRPDDAERLCAFHDRLSTRTARLRFFSPLKHLSPDFAKRLTSVDFVKRYIFPGCQIPSMARMAESWAETTDFRLVSLEDLTPHYAWTLRAWRERFLENREKVAEMGYPERFLRMWEFYLAYCEGGFAERRIGDVQILLARPENRDLPLLPPLHDAPAIPAE